MAEAQERLQEPPAPLPPSLRPAPAGSTPPSLTALPDLPLALVARFCEQQPCLRLAATCRSMLVFVSRECITKLKLRWPKELPRPGQVEAEGDGAAARALARAAKSLGALLKRFPRLTCLLADDKNGAMNGVLGRALKEHGPIPPLRCVEDLIHARPHGGIPFPTLIAACAGIEAIEINQSTPFLGTGLHDWAAFTAHLVAPRGFPGLQSMALEVPGGPSGPTMLSQLFEALSTRFATPGRPPLTGLEIHRVRNDSPTVATDGPASLPGGSMGALYWVRRLLLDDAISGQLQRLHVLPTLWGGHDNAALSLIADYLAIAPRPALTELGLFLDPLNPTFGPGLLALLHDTRAPNLAKLHVRNSGEQTGLELQELLAAGALPCLDSIRLGTSANTSKYAWRALSRGKLNELVRIVDLNLISAASGAHFLRGFVHAVLVPGRFPGLEMLDLDCSWAAGEGDDDGLWDAVLAYLDQKRWPKLAMVYLPAWASDTVLQRMRAALPWATVHRMPR